MQTYMLLKQYVVAAMLAWSPVQEHAPEPPESVEARYAARAADIASIVLDEEEPAVLPQDPWRARSALLLASLRFHEGRNWAFVERGDCNHRGFRNDGRGDCDQGRAFGGYQIQPGRGISLDGHEWKLWRIGSSDARITGPDLLADGELEARVALHMVRQSLRVCGSLSIYTGEPCRGLHPHSDARMKKARDWFRQHPFGEGDS